MPKPCAAVAALLLFAAAVPAADPPADDLPACPPDWKVTVVVGAPKLVNPSVVCCAPDGRIFVAEDPMDMGNDSTKPTDRILCVHPDGTITVFAENLHAVFGLAYIDGKVYVHHCPKFSVFTDENGVGKGRKDLIETTNPRPNTGFNDHIPSNIRLGMDGWLYMSTGDKGIYGAVGTDGSKAEIRGGGVLRLRPDGSHLEVFSTGTRNHLDVAINAEDDVFTYDNTDDGNGWWTRVTHMVDGGFYGYPWDYKPQRPYTLWMMTDFGGGSPTGATAYNEDALPAKYRGNLFLCEWGRKQLIRLDVKRDGGTYKIAERDNFLTAGKSEFRPVGITVSPDGMSLYVTDWQFGGWKQNKQVGRLLKVTYTGTSEAAPQPKWYIPAATGQKFEATTAELVEGLKHPAQCVRLVAQRRLADRGAEAVKPVTELMADSKAPPFARWSALWTLDAIDGGKASRKEIIAAMLPGVKYADNGRRKIVPGTEEKKIQDADPSFARQAARQLGTAGNKDAVPALAALFEHHRDPSVQFHAATAMGRIGDTDAIDALDSENPTADLFARYAAFTALNRIGRANPSAWAGILEGLGYGNHISFAVRDTFDPALVNALAAIITPERANSDKKRIAALAAIAPLHRKPQPWNGQWWGTQPVRTPKPVGVVEWAGTQVVEKAVAAALADADPVVRRAAAEGAAVIRGADFTAPLLALYKQDESTETRKVVLRALAEGKDPAVASYVVFGLLADPSKNADLQADAVGVAEKIGGPKAVEALTKIVSTPSELDATARAITALGKLKATAAIPAIAARLGSGNAAIRIAASDALTAIGGPAVVKALVPVLADGTPETRRLAVAALGSVKSPAAVEPLLKAFADPETRFEAVAALAATPDVRALEAYLDGLASKNATVREACRKAVAAIKAAALPKIEARLDQTPPLAQTVVGELQRVYAAAAPITGWRVVGSFDLAGKDPFDPTAPDFAAGYKDSQGKPATWKPAKTDPAGKVDLQRQGFTNTNDVFAFATATVDSPAARAVEFVAGSDDGLVVWVNGTKVHEALGNRGYKADEFRIKADLKAGANVIVAKITQGGGPWEFSIAVPAAGTGKLFAAAAPKVNPAEYEAFAAKNAGNPARGKVLFADVKGLACAKCHRVGGADGGDVGPDLAGIGAKYNRQQLIESVLYPSKQILDGYQQTKIATADGRVLTGIVRGETPEDVTLLDADAKKHVVKKADIDERKVLDKSVMPDGQQAGIGVKDFADLIAYLEGLKEKPPAKKE